MRTFEHEEPKEDWIPVDAQTKRTAPADRRDGDPPAPIDSKNRNGLRAVRMRGGASDAVRGGVWPTTR